MVFVGSSRKYTGCSWYRGPGSFFLTNDKYVKKLKEEKEEFHWLQLSIRRVLIFHICDVSRENEDDFKQYQSVYISLNSLAQL